MSKYYRNIILALACLISSLPSISYAAGCEDVLKEGIFGDKKFSMRSKLETARFSQLARTSTTDIGASGEAVSYGSGSYEKKEADTLQKSELNWLKQGTDWDYALMSGDSAIIDAWSNCIRNQGGGPAAFIEAKNKNDNVLHLKLVSSKLTGGDLETHITHTVQLPKGFKFIDNFDCLKKNAPITVGECIVNIAGANPSVPLQLTIKTNRTDISVYLPPRLKVVREEERIIFSNFELGMGPAANGETNKILNLPKGWSLVPKSVRHSHTSKGAVGGGITCGIKSIEEESSLVKLVIWLDNNSSNDSGQCLFTVQARKYRFKSKPI